MSLQYLLDGYNILHQMPQMIQKEIEDQRQDFVTAIEVNNPQGSSRNSIIVVFDGRPGRASPIRASRVKVIFSLDESADDRIKRMVAQASNQKNMIIVTDDRAIQYAVKALGAKVCSVPKFLDKLKSSSTKKCSPSTKVKSSEKKKYIPKNLESKITSEMQDIWLKKKH